MRRRQATLGIALVAAGCAAAVLAPAAAGSTVDGVSGGFMRAAPGEQNVITISGGIGAFVITDTAGVTAPSPCTTQSPTQVTCPTAPSVLAGDMDDRVTVTATSNSPPSFPPVSGEAGNDILDMSGLAALSSGPIQGGDGADLIRGGDRGSIITGGAGDDQIFGNGGKDFIKAGEGADVIDAGEGSDLIITLLDPTGSTTATDNAFTDDNTVDTVTCGGNIPGVGDIDNPAIPPTDSAQTGLGDLVGADCEEVIAVLSCPAGQICEGVPTVTAGAEGAGRSLATAAKKKGKGGSNVVGRGKGKVKVKGGQLLKVYVKIDAKKARKALGARAQVPATLGLQSKKRKKKGGRGSRIRFKLKK